VKLRAKPLLLLLALGSVLGGCSGGGELGAAGGSLPGIDGPGIRAVLAGLERPAVVNVWASWCAPCRSEAPLLAAAHAAYSDRVEFIGIDVADTRADAARFIQEFGLDFAHYFDPPRAVPAELGGVGIPITYFVDAAGEVVETHSGIIDERTLALMLDEIAG
jgi:cytochrome c biogenesis protein CcmG/thiol:disulfide interchange protein DsbE